MTLSGYDAAYPPSAPPATDFVLIYCGGDTPHVWTDQEIAAQTARYRLPCWVRSYAGVDPAADAAAFRTWLEAHGCPKGVATVLDLETLVDRVYVLNFGAAMHSFGWLVLPYGSRSTLYQNPSLDGYFDAHPEDPAGTVDPGNVASQDVYTNAYDLDYILNSVPLWDTRPPTPGSTTPTPAAPTLPTVEDDEEMPISDNVTFKPGQTDFFQVSPAGDLWHKWSFDGGKTWPGNEALPSYVKFAVRKPVVTVFADGIRVRVEDNSAAGMIYEAFQSISAGAGWEWTALR